MTTPESFSDLPPDLSKPGPGGRLHRQDAQREAPIRNVYTAARSGRQDNTANAASSEAEKLAYGVDLGYDVINEQIAKARDLAAQWRGPNGKHPSKAESATDWRHIAGRMLHAYQDLGAVYLDAMQKLVDNIAGDAVDEPAPQPTAAGHSSPVNIAIKLRTAVAAEADLNLSPGSCGELGIAALHGPPGTMPITTCTFSCRDLHNTVLTIEVVDGTPAGIYSGVVVDIRSNEPCGTLCLRVGAS